MKKVAVVYHSGYGHTEVVANEVFSGAKEIEQVDSTLFKVEEVTDDPSILSAYDAIIMGAPTYMGSLSSSFKLFMEATAEIWYAQKWKNKIAAGFTNSHSLSGDKLNSLIQISVFAAQHGMIWVGQGELNASPDNDPGKFDVINRIGSFLGMMAQSENESPQVTPPEGDKITARLLGKRVAEVAKAFKL